MNTTRATPELTAYQLTCGYVQRKEIAPGVEVTLFYEHGAFHVRKHDFNVHNRLSWSVYRTWREAQRAYAHA